ncbi:hypothetical protein AT246_06820 [Bartonella henselae]|uniref:Phage related protein n=4 Tax=Bartonella TaxID=773 RepID=X5M8X8_BARHN|nr:DUF1376 domain-containing protein [Bartonella henselae]MDM9983908.1 DUF1376 domain-containing protein [Bartonella henselae]MDM9997275.1 DUF1376 domain-containing protein [Bartonella henselae]MDM9998709.1 DUF1376 domain-containing protein [Bartonella henselae]OLL48627.1 hypothetical protein AT247_07675 [Bartonella henselae]OLL50844.1 hypothetical protein AT243_00070 [Bartonella henselae]
MQHANQQENPYYESCTLPYVCWYQNDFLGGVRGMRAHEIGIYTILLNEMYARGRPLELSIERLARLCGCDKRTFVNVLEMLVREGKILNLAHGLWNKRCENVFYERAKLLEQKSFAGRSSAKKRKKINAEIQQLLNERARNDKRNSESQKVKEKETPYGVSEKPSFLMQTGEEKGHETTCTDLCSGCTSTQTSTQACSLTAPPEQEGTKHCADFIGEQAKFSGSSGQTKSRSMLPKGQRLPSDWQADIGAAISEGLSEEQARWQEKKFRDYWHAKSGKEALKVDWQATWRNWFRREIERIKDHQERLAMFSSHASLTRHSSDSDALYRTLINYRTNKHEHDC